MADLKINITAQDKATPTINAVGKSMASLGKTAGAAQSTLQAFATGGLPAVTHQLGALSAGIGGLAGQLGLMIGAGGIGGLTAGVVQLLPQMVRLGDQFFGWATGIDSIAAAYDDLDPKLKQHLERMEEIQRQNILMGTTGSERARLEQTFVKQQIARLEKERDVREKAVLETKKWLAVTFAGIPLASVLYEKLTGRLKKQEEALTDVNNRLAQTQLLAEGAGKNLGLEEAEEGKKRLEKLREEAEKFNRIIKEINREGERRVAVAKLPVMGESEFLMAKQPLPTIFGPGGVEALKEKQLETIV